MGGEDGVRAGKKRVFRRDGFCGEHVQRGARSLPRGEGFGQRRLIEDATSGHVDEVDATLHGSKLGSPDDAARLFGERRVHADDVRPLKELGQAHQSGANL